MENKTIPLLAPDTLVHNHYRIVNIIAQGDGGAVYEAIDESRTQVVALKHVVPTNEQLSQLFEQKAKILTGLRHPTLPTIVDYFTNEQGHFLVMDFVPGEDLGITMEKIRTPLTTEAVLKWGDQILNALEYLQRQQPPIVHGDIKPENLKLTRKGQILLLDFGFSGSAQNAPDGNGNGATKPSPYEAPEKMHGKRDPRSDLYALAATMYYLLSGSLPDDAISRAATKQKEGMDPLRPVHKINPHVSSAINAVLQQALDLDVDKRPASATEMRADLQGARNVPKTDDTAQKATRPVYTGKPVEPSAPAASTPRTGPLSPPPQTQTQSNVPWLFLAGAAVVVVLIVAWFLSGGTQNTTAGPTDVAMQSSTTNANTDASTDTDTNTNAMEAEEPTTIATSVSAADEDATIPTETLSETIPTATKAPASTPTSIPISEVAISEANANQVKQLAQWEDPDSVPSVAFSPDGKTIASGSWDNSVKLWRASDGTLLHTLEGHSDNVECVTFSPDGQTVASGSWDGTVRLWKVDDGSSIGTFEWHTDTVYDVAFSPDGKMLASCSEDKTVRMWYLSGGMSLHTLEGHKNTVFAVAFSPDGKMLASGSADQTINLWNVSDAAFVRSLNNKTDKVYTLAFSPDGQTIAAGSGMDVQLWRVSDSTLQHTLEGHDIWVGNLDFSPDGKLLVTGGGDWTARLWKLSDGSLLNTIEGFDESVLSVNFAPDGRRFVAGSKDKTIRVWGIEE